MTRRCVLLFVFFISVSILYVHAEQSNCPFNLINDPYPGQCSRYRDINDNGICDLSEIEKDISEETVTPDTVIYNEDIYRDSPIDSEENLPADTLSVLNEDSSLGQQIAEAETKAVSKDRYALRIILPIWLLLMVFTIIAKYSKRIPMRNINQMWNWLILISFIPVSLTSIMLILRELGIVNSEIIFDCVFIHNLTGIIFILSSIAHIYIKWIYYKNCLKQRKCEDK